MLSLALIIFDTRYCVFLALSVVNQFVRMHLCKCVRCFDLDEVLLQVGRLRLHS